jgi:hypothetical protein
MIMYTDGYKYVQHPISRKDKILPEKKDTGG